MVLAQDSVAAAEEPEPIDNQGLWAKIKGGVQKITGAVGESISQLVSKFFTAIGDFFLSTICLSVLLEVRIWLKVNPCLKLCG